MPTSALPGTVAVTLSTTTLRLYCVLQLPQERYSLPKSLTWKFRMYMVPGPLCWKTLSDALRAPPPSMVIVCDAEVPLKVAASSPTSSHQTLRRVQLPRQCTPSAAGAPMMTLDSVAPSESSNSGPWLSSWLPSPRSPPPTNSAFAPSKVPLTFLVAVSVVAPVAFGHTVATPLGEAVGVPETVAEAVAEPGAAGDFVGLGELVGDLLGLGEEVAVGEAGAPDTAVTDTSSNAAAAEVVSKPIRPDVSRVVPLPTGTPSTEPPTRPPETSTRSVCHPDAAGASGTLARTVTVDPRTSSSLAAFGASTKRSN